ncbi:hypothetical protein F4678DRAFT_102042 [Xylaria arbuscula]|nr:hypothetical protein F4678DRAFT_102042 [Xylaria arbuscula]
MEAVKSAISRFSLRSSRRILPTQDYADDESRDYIEDEQKQGFLGSKDSQPVKHGNTPIDTATQPYTLSIYRVVAIVVGAVLLTAAGSVFLTRSVTRRSGNRLNYPDVSKHATEVIADLIKTSEPAEFRMKSPCGSTPEEARARGCHFDTISFCWYPDECYDSELVAAFEATRDWEYYADEEGTQPISREELIGGDGNNLWVRWEYHVRHCLYQWIKLHRAVLAKGDPNLPQIDSYIASLNHTNHCGEVMLNDRDVAFSTINTETLVKFPDCGMI